MSLGKSAIPDPLVISSLHKDYEVTFDHSVGETIGRLSDLRNAVCVVDKALVSLYRSELSDLAARFPMYEVEALESSKTLEGVQTLIEWLLDSNCNRSTTVVAIGGGVIQDLVTFTSNIFYRGTSFVLVPTTLLSMCDSCIGAKCGINFMSFKNQLGVIHAPSRVHIGLDFLDTLPDLAIKSGYGEVLKLSITDSRQGFVALRSSVEAEGLRGPHLLRLIHQSLLTKKAIIEVDEYETDLRRILNYGHTFGHALEALTNHEIPHGLAVAWGIDLINFIAWQDQPDLEDLFEETHFFIRNFLPFRLDDFPSAASLVEMTRRDKKMIDDQIFLAVPRGFGDLGISPRTLDNQLVERVAEYLATSNVYSV